ncbi:MAG: hypothetical protein QW307_03610 [Thermoplasmata archaeon]
MIDVEQEVQFTYPDPVSGIWKSKTGTIKELLETYTAFQFLQYIVVNSIKKGSLEEI